MSRRPDRQRPEFVFVPIGGVGEIGMNLYLYGYGPPDDREWLIVDMGITFGSETEPGVDVILPDIGPLGQAALLVATARLPLRDSDPTAEIIAASYLAAGMNGSVTKPLSPAALLSAIVAVFNHDAAAPDDAQVAVRSA